MAGGADIPKNFIRRKASNDVHAKTLGFSL